MDIGQNCDVCHIHMAYPWEESGKPSFSQCSSLLRDEYLEYSNTLVCLILLLLSRPFLLPCFIAPCPSPNAWQEVVAFNLACCWSPSQANRLSLPLIPPSIYVYHALLLVIHSQPSLIAFTPPFPPSNSLNILPSPSPPSLLCLYSPHLSFSPKHPQSPTMNKNK